MSCGNCGKEFTDGVVKVDKILSSWDRNKDSQIEISHKSGEDIPPQTEPVGADSLLTSTPSADPPEAMEVEVVTSAPLTISICEALSVVFEIPAVSGKSYSDLEDEETVFPRFISSKSREPDLKTADPKNEGDPELQEVEPEEASNPLDLCLECAETLTLLYNSFKDFTRICKLESEVAKRLEELEKTREGQVSAVHKVGRGKKRVVIKKSKGGQRGGVKVEIKREVQSEIDEFSELEDGDDGYYVDDSLSSSPPDSPVNLDFDAIPRSPRPVRNSSARNKDWSSFYKDEYPDDEDEEEGEEGTAEPLEIEPEEGGDADPMELLKNVEVEWEEERDRDYDPSVGMSDDDDEEYRPDSDLEGLAEVVGPRRRRPQKRRHGSMFKSINRSIRHIVSRTPSGNFECLECGKYFAHKKSLERHCRTHTDDSSSVQCPTCHKTFSRDDHLKRHRRVVHGEDIPMRYTRKGESEGHMVEARPKQQKCPVCEESFNGKEMEEHVATHGVENPWKCKDCPMVFPVFTDLSKHKSVHYERQRVKCDVCSKEFRGTYHMKRHQLSIHHARSDRQVVTFSSDEEEEEPEETKFLDEQGNVIISIPKEKKNPKLFKCQECGKKYAKSEKLTEHLICHGIGERYRCEVCGREFNHIRSKQRHMFLHSPDNPYKCTQEGCDKGFSRKDHYVRHLQNIHNIDPPEGDGGPVTKAEKKPRAPPEKEVQCPHCDKVIKRERLRLHMVIHTGEKRHMCDLCGQKFGLRTTLLTHIQCVHQGVRRYTCTFCGQAFKRSNHLKDHEKLHTDADSKPFICNVCGKAFRREKNLKSHMICHVGSKDYMCEICGKAFNRIDNMRAHVKTVHQGLCIRKKKQAAPSTVAAGVEGEVTLEVAEGSVIMKTDRQQGRKRQARVKEPINVGPAPATAILVAVDPVDPEQMDQEHELRAVDEDSNNSFEPQLPPRTSIVQLGPNQTVLNPQNPGQPFQGNFTTYYQYYTY